MLKGGYPFWNDDVPKGMSRDQYKRLEKTKPITGRGKKYTIK